MVTLPIPVRAYHADPMPMSAHLMATAGNLLARHKPASIGIAWNVYEGAWKGILPVGGVINRQFLYREGSTEELVMSYDDADPMYQMAETIYGLGNYLLPELGLADKGLTHIGILARRKSMLLLCGTATRLRSKHLEGRLVIHPGLNGHDRLEQMTSLLEDFPGAFATDQNEARA